MTKSFHRNLLLPLSLFFFVYSYSQDFVYKHYDLQDGLANPTIHSIFQDKEGFLWFGTESGLCRYDGSRFKTFTIKDGLLGNDVFALYQDTRGRIWLQQYKNTVAYIYNGKVYNEQNDTLLKQIKLTNRLHGIAEDGEGNIGLCDNEAFYIIAKENNRVKAIRSIDGQPLSSIGLYVDDAGKFIICTTEGLYALENGQLKCVRTLPSEKRLMSATAILLNRHYIAFSYDFKNITVYLKDTAIQIKLPIDYIFKYSALSDSTFSINTTDGAFLFNTHNYSLVKILPGVRVTNTFLDRENNLWIGTVSKGIYKIGSVEIVNKKISDSQNDIYYITKEDDHIIVGNNNSTIYEYRNNEFIKKNTPVKQRLSVKIFYYEKLKDHTALVANGMALATYKNGIQNKFRHTVMLKQVSPADEQHVLMAVHVGLYLVRKKDLVVMDTIWNRKSLCSLKTNDSLLIGTTAGLYLLKQIGSRYMITDSLLSSSIIGDVKKSANNLVWVSTYEDGLYCLENGHVTRHFTDTSGLPSNNCRSLYIHDNDVWLGTDKGLVKIAAEKNDFYVKKYGTSDGLPSNIINSIYIDGNRVYAGTPEGLCYFNETSIETTSICNLVLTGVRIGDSLTDVTNTNTYSLHWKQPFTIEFSGISFRSEQEITYRYRINGLDKNWRKTNLNSLEFTSLRPGNYELEIVAVNKFGKESNTLKIQVHVKRPFYRSAWFISLVVLLPLFIILFFYNRSKNRARQRHVQKLKQEIKILELEQMALRAQMNPHFIFNCISAIQQLVTENDTDSTYQFLDSFSTLVRKTLDNAPELFISLDEEIQFLTSYFELERIRLEDRFSYNINTANIIDTHHWNVPNMVIQPFAENAIRHGIRYKQNGKGFVEISFEQQDTLLRCTITDNGIGREMAAKLQKEAVIPHISRGIGITVKRIESLNALTNGKISIMTEDMKDGKGNPSGTKVIIDFYKIDNRNDKNHYN